MNNENLAFLQDSLKYMGFGDLHSLNEQLGQHIAREAKDFQLFTESYYEDDYKLEGALYFRRGDKSDMYFFNKYDALLRDGFNEDNDRRQTFYISKGTGVRFGEAFNLLQGRSVNKDLTNMEGEKYNAWIQLNFEELDTHQNHKVKQFRVQYGYDLEKILEKYPIREMKNEDSKAALLRSLRKGNLQQVTFVKTNRPEKMLIEASPQFKTVNIYSVVNRGDQRVAKKRVPSLVEEPGIQPDTESSELWEETEQTEMEEVNEEEKETVVSKPPSKRGSRK